MTCDTWHMTFRRHNLLNTWMLNRQPTLTTYTYYFTINNHRLIKGSYVRRKNYFTPLLYFINLYESIKIFKNISERNLNSEEIYVNNLNFIQLLYLHRILIKLISKYLFETWNNNSFFLLVHILEIEIFIFH